MGEGDDSMNRLATKAGRASFLASPRIVAYARPSCQCFATCGNLASNRARRSSLAGLLAFLHGSLYAISVYSHLQTSENSRSCERGRWSAQWHPGTTARSPSPWLDPCMHRASEHGDYAHRADHRSLGVRIVTYTFMTPLRLQGGMSNVQRWCVRAKTWCLANAPTSRLDIVRRLRAAVLPRRREVLRALARHGAPHPVVVGLSLLPLVAAIAVRERAVRATAVRAGAERLRGRVVAVDRVGARRIREVREWRRERGVVLPVREVRHRGPEQRADEHVLPVVCRDTSARAGTRRKQQGTHGGSPLCVRSRRAQRRRMARG
jgi:hypothetical protein